MNFAISIKLTNSHLNSNEKQLQKLSNDEKSQQKKKDLIQDNKNYNLKLKDLNEKIKIANNKIIEDRAAYKRTDAQMMYYLNR